MTPEQYAAAQAAIVAAVLKFVGQLSTLFLKPRLDPPDWNTLLELLFPRVEAARTESAELAREFYDSQREIEFPDVERNDTFLVEYPIEQFTRDMEPVRRRISLEDAPPSSVGEIQIRIARTVENAGRQQIIKAVKTEPVEKILRGWARVATGRETCAWCLMLVSRGPVYYSAETSGLYLDDESALRMIAAGTDVSEYMEEWHDGCDCKVVPVFKRDGWEQSAGGQAAKRALAQWDDATKVAKLLQRLEPDKVHPSGQYKGEPFTLNELVINELRRRLNAGEITPSEFAALAA